jgi:large subunit ribosomal protein L7e
VPIKDDILVPETLLKKRKSQEKAREERAIETREKRGKLTMATSNWRERSR